MKFEDLKAKLQDWVLGLSTTLNRRNPTFLDGITLMMPREKDIIITFPGDRESIPEQPPSIVLELHMGKALGHNFMSDFSGTVDVILYLVDDASTGAEARTKIIRWADTLWHHCTAVLPGTARIVPVEVFWTMGQKKDAASNVNVFEIQMLLSITI